jgi:asparagine synthase (glutamine-hydrolysing)
MCGLAGIVTEDKELQGRIHHMVEALTHRGPDDDGIEFLSGAVLGHRRLSIIDLEHGHQPMFDASGTLVTVYNGEIYNFLELRSRLANEGHEFRTHSDTEVLLALYREYGPGCVEHLEGMFAFAIWDEANRTLFMARDHMGQKPLFYCRHAGGIAFASEIKAFLQAGLVDPEPDHQALYHYISLRFLPGEATMFRGVSKLPAAHRLIWRDGDLRIERYWQMSFIDKLSGTEPELTDALEARLQDTVTAHTVSDVPVGTFLSGGIDSSLITAMMAKGTSESVPTFSIGVVEQDFNELPYARSVADQYGTEHHDEVVSANLVGLLPDMVWHLEEPADPFGVGVYLVSRLAAQHVKVVLSGDGGDELFAGYDRFAGSRYVDWLAIIPAIIRRSVAPTIIDWIPDTFTYKSLAQKLRWANEMSLSRGGDRYADAMSFLRFTEDNKRRLFTESALADLGDLDSRDKILEHYDSEHAETPVDRMLYTDLMTRMPDHLLTIVDRMAMAHSLEVRPPLLEHRMVEFAARIPDAYKLKRARLKHILREVATRSLSDDLVNRKKQGFGFPLAHWMRSELRGVLEDALRTSRFVAAGVFDPGFIAGLIEEHVSGRRDHNFRLWIFLNLEIWHRRFIEGQSASELAEWLERMGPAAGPRAAQSRG